LTPALLSLTVIQGLVNPLHGNQLSPAEVTRIESDLGITLSEQEKADLTGVIFPDGPIPQWRVDAEDRIKENRIANLRVEVVDPNGNPVSHADVQIRQKSNAFRFGGIMSAKDFHDEDGNLQISTQRYKDLFLALFNSGGLDNGLKPRLRSGNEHLLPAIFEWAQANNLPMRGHTLIWPGNPNNNHMPNGETSRFIEGEVPYNILSKVTAVEDAISSGVDQQTIDNLKTDLRNEINFMITDWSSKWPVYEWDVINEPRANHQVQDVLGDAEMAEWFKITDVNSAIPECDLFLNENQVISAKSAQLQAGYYEQRRDNFMYNANIIAQNGGPINGLGFQSRFKWERLDPAIIHARLEEFAQAYGYKMAGTEFEIVDREDSSGQVVHSFTELERAVMTEEVMTAYYSHPLVTGLNAWTYMKDRTAAWCLYDGSVKLNGLVWYYLHRIRYSTNADGTTGTDGSVLVEAHKGDYTIQVQAGGRDYSAEVSLDDDYTHRVVVEDSTISGKWGIYDIFESNFVDTAGWLGVLQVEHSPWIWSLDLATWVYTPLATVSDGLGWVYFPPAI